MSQSQIREMVEAFAAAAERCQRGGIDGVELHGSHGYLPQQFMSAMLNRREDEYGGSFENRMRFTVEVLAAIREQVGPGYPVRSEEHTSELQSLMRISYAVFCLKKNSKQKKQPSNQKSKTTH